MIEPAVYICWCAECLFWLSFEYKMAAVTMYTVSWRCVCVECESRVPEVVCVRVCVAVGPSVNLYRAGKLRVPLLFPISLASCPCHNGVTTSSLIRWPLRDVSMSDLCQTIPHKPNTDLVHWETFISSILFPVTQIFHWKYKYSAFST